VPPLVTCFVHTPKPVTVQQQTQLKVLRQAFHDADIHSLLADIGMEQENFESTLQDHRRALELLSSILQVHQDSHA